MDRKAGTDPAEARVITACPAARAVRRRISPPFLLRGINQVKAERALICTANNIPKLARAA
jgi:hypothetical protein